MKSLNGSQIIISICIYREVPIPEQRSDLDEYLPTVYGASRRIVVHFDDVWNKVHLLNHSSPLAGISDTNISAPSHIYGKIARERIRCDRDPLCQKIAEKFYAGDSAQNEMIS